ncbi:hypothetical protein Bbelb_013400 [Branchiostoma belcheri]|nr:hypothetical protein Bbelb_013400 [Branchiostoma belcheri]
MYENSDNARCQLGSRLNGEVIPRATSASEDINYPKNAATKRAGALGESARQRLAQLSHYRYRGKNCAERGRPSPTEVKTGAWLRKKREVRTRVGRTVHFPTHSGHLVRLSVNRCSRDTAGGRQTTAQSNTTLHTLRGNCFLGRAYHSPKSDVTPRSNMLLTESATKRTDPTYSVLYEIPLVLTDLQHQALVSLLQVTFRRCNSPLYWVVLTGGLWRVSGPAGAPKLRAQLVSTLPMARDITTLAHCGEVGEPTGHTSQRKMSIRFHVWLYDYFVLSPGLKHSPSHTDWNYCLPKTAPERLPTRKGHLLADTFRLELNTISHA